MYLPFDPYLRNNLLFTNRNRLLNRTAAPSIEPLTLAETKLYLRVDNTNDDSLISDLIVAARMMAENWLKRSLISQSWQLAYDYGIPNVVGLPMGPINSITSVIVTNRDSTTQTVDSSTYWLNAAQNSLVLDTALMGFQIEINYNAGYGDDASLVPKPIKQGMLAHIAAMYDSRGEDGAAVLPEQTVGLYMPFREVRL